MNPLKFFGSVENISKTSAVMLQSKMQNIRSETMSKSRSVSMTASFIHGEDQLLLYLLHPDISVSGLTQTERPVKASRWRTKQSVVWSANLPFSLSEKQPVTPVLLTCLQTISPWKVQRSWQGCEGHLTWVEASLWPETVKLWVWVSQKFSLLIIETLLLVMVQRSAGDGVICPIVKTKHTLVPQLSHPASLTEFCCLSLYALVLVSSQLTRGFDMPCA